MRGSMQSYRKVSVESDLSVASPHRIIQMLFAGALERLAQAKCAIEQGDIAQRGLLMGKAIGIVSGLNGSLNMDAEGDVANNLTRLYDYMLRRMSEANINNDAQAIDEVVAILKTLKEGWDAIPADKHNMSSHSDAS
ncbi:flagellar export chaperone FliS [Shewanella sp. JNE10-2]|uniref:flagellar export chaperone FliS n=1 Tax=unclassified Shewanella TaxID=196818 RepID=UPI002006B116|nr:MULTISPECIES: flagellar export chaperone FliS [unclassified Shewanella]MCK7630291.1 flagellar export chaperone FliS [Shewanella sp. JNE9-1]MCK7645458.1 flagellar export chaperone FliS [Shewanella sp. JNE3-1]MCK7653451.1 flagellar export chaperone FliS [Shewanella sp. JNE4-1]UPO26946.1 flagellar export chaperone FliS [Shewanella sp. JNE10-2]UPO34142.1 flagellar export chaperone FliS [Shewanella sp. JNE7]